MWNPGYYLTGLSEDRGGYEAIACVTAWGLPVPPLVGWRVLQGVYRHIHDCHGWQLHSSVTHLWLSRLATTLLSHTSMTVAAGNYTPQSRINDCHGWQLYSSVTHLWLSRLATTLLSHTSMIFFIQSFLQYSLFNHLITFITQSSSNTLHPVI